MGTRVLGNLGGVEIGAWDMANEQSFKRAVMRAHKETRLALEKLDRAQSLLSATSASEVRNNTSVTNIFTSGAGGGTNAVVLSYPMALFGSEHLFPAGVPIHATSKVRVRRAYLQADPSITATGATAFTIQNASSSPSSTGTVTFASGASIAESTFLAVTIPALGRVYVKAPATLNAIQNIYMVRLEFDIL